MTVHPNIKEYLADPNSVPADVKGALDAVGPWLLRKKRDQLLFFLALYGTGLNQ